MKKLVITSVLGIALAASTAFGQGYVIFAGGLRTVWDYNSVGQADSGFDAVLLWAPSTTTSALVDAIEATTPINDDGIPAPYSTAWADISNSAAAGGGWTVATTNGSIVVAAPVTSNGSFSVANGGVNIGIDGTSVSEVLNFYVVAWDTDYGLYNTLSAAEQGGAAVGWSSVFQMTLGAPAPAMPAAPTTIENQFGIGVPEPTTLALAGLGGLSMLFLRRKKGLSLVCRANLSWVRSDKI